MLKAVDRRPHTYWEAVCARDRTFDGIFFYSVATTGVYCRPACPARRPKRENVTFHASCREAEIAGFRPCKRCKPQAADRSAQYVRTTVEACRLIETAEEPLRLAETAKALGLSPSHFHRIFSSVLGITPRAYALANRQARLRHELKGPQTVTAAILASGYHCTNQFYAQSDASLGMTPTEFRSGGAGVIRFAVGQCSLGSFLVAASDKGIVAILLGSDPEILVRTLEDSFPRSTLIGGDRKFEKSMAKVVGLVDGCGPKFDLPLEVRGTAFQHRVWQALRRIPAGTTVTYKELAERIGMPKAVRAVASACAANQIAIAIPCHRVVRTDGSLSGYRWGVERKRALIDREAKSAQQPRLKAPRSRR